MWVGRGGAQVFLGKNTLFGVVNGMETQIQGGKNLETIISDYGAPTHIRFNNAYMEKIK